jgi:hypothetical protein
MFMQMVRIISGVILVCLALLLAVANTKPQAGVMVSEREAAALFGGACVSQQSFDCPDGPNPDKSGFNCSAEPLYQLVTGGTKYQTKTAGYCGNFKGYCGVYSRKVSSCIVLSSTSASPPPP